MAAQMKAAQIVEFDKPYQLCETPKPICGENDLLVQVYAAGFCHSDLQVLQGQFPASLPMIPSHEPAGKIVQVGAQVQGSWNVGDRVGVLNFKNACRQCATAWGALGKLRREVKSGEAIAIVGIGGVGHLAVQFAKAMGFRTVAIDNREEGRHLALEVAEHLKPDLVIDSTASDADDQILDFTLGEGLGGVVVCTDSIAANAWSLQQLGNKGVMVPLGLPKDKWQFDSEAMVFRELVIKGSYVSSAEEAELMFKVVAENRIASHLTILGFDQIPSLVDKYLHKSMKGRLVIQIAQ
ncbi:NAD(P)-binding protein [Didymella exigua CBS 183.55]|uniref:NAD(P)-binding protein n=1 Tax=Didymella exigua CBS 183.55 TaxID=1150837 RepID=A0A6A5RMQ6_9PLEO|nr:NAD(P)-binding protein [Didymella exigua CBS 183.55]KAF1928418.1 NAD(P)-binding protein [Didymella exigua CBS 183.55]